MKITKVNDNETVYNISSLTQFEIALLVRVLFSKGYEWASGRHACDCSIPAGLSLHTYASRKALTFSAGGLGGGPVRRLEFTDKERALLDLVCAPPESHKITIDGKDILLSAESFNNLKAQLCGGK